MCPPSMDSPDQCSRVAIPRSVLTDHVGVDIVVLGEFYEFSKECHQITKNISMASWKLGNHLFFFKKKGGWAVRITWRKGVRRAHNCHESGL